MARRIILALGGLGLIVGAACTGTTTIPSPPAGTQATVSALATQPAVQTAVSGAGTAIAGAGTALAGITPPSLTPGGR
jgi:hypothetical protein